MSATIAHGVDLLEVEGFARLFDGPGRPHLSRYFTDAELDAVGSDSRRWEKLAGRFAMKEAVLKALGTGWGDFIGFKDVEIFTSVLGAPSVTLHRKLVDIAAVAGIDRWLVSSSHSNGQVMASVIGVGTYSP